MYTTREHSTSLLSNHNHLDTTDIIAKRKRRQLDSHTCIFFILVSLLLIIRPAASQQQPCPYSCQALNGQTQPQLCEGRVGNCLELSCDILAGFWYLAPTTNNKTIGTSANDVRLPNYRIDTSQGNNRLTILALNQENYGQNRILSIEPDIVNPRSCYFSIFVSSDPITSPATGNFTLNGATKRVDVPGTFIVNIDSFNAKIVYSYLLETLPLDVLKVNNEIVDSNLCSNDQSTLKCLRIDGADFPVQKCLATYRVDLSYDFTFAPYSNDPQYDPKIFTQDINLQFPPKVRYNVIEIPYRNFDQLVDLRCEVDCANPNTNIRYTWRNAADNSLISETTVNTYQYRVLANSVNDIFQVTCTVDNTIPTNYIGESQTRFVLKYLDPASTRDGGGGLPVWAIIVIAVGGFLLLLLLILLVVLFLLARKKKSKEPEKMPTRSVHQDLTANPVYGNQKLIDLNRNSGSTGMVYNIERDFDNRAYTSDIATKTKV